MAEYPNFGKVHESQRGYFSAQLYEEMLKNPDIWLILGDLGYGVFEKHREKFPDRVVNVGAAENAMVGVGIGLALEGKVPFCYSITPFLLYRSMELIRNYINHEKIPVKLVGTGRNRDYEYDGFSHWAEEDKDLMRMFTNIIPFWPEDKESIPALVTQAINDPKPYYINLRR